VDLTPSMLWEVAVRIPRYGTVLLVFFLLLSSWAAAASKSALTIKVLSAKTETIQISDSNNAPTDCNQVSYSAYCGHSQASVKRNIMLVQDNHGKSYTIACEVESKWSKCVSLPVGETFDAESQKHGILVWYEDSKGKPAKQSYTLVAMVDKPAAEKASVATPARQSATPASPASSAATAAPADVSQIIRDTIKCNFTSTPSGAEITLDGRYVGNTPSTVGVTTGTHVVVLFMPGFDKWKRELTVPYGSDLNISATLQKTAQ